MSVPSKYNSRYHLSSSKFYLFITLSECILASFVPSFLLASVNAPITCVYHHCLLLLFGYPESFQFTSCFLHYCISQYHSKECRVHYIFHWILPVTMLRLRNLSLWAGLLIWWCLVPADRLILSVADKKPWVHIRVSYSLVGLYATTITKAVTKQYYFTTKGEC